MTYIQQAYVYIAYLSPVRYKIINSTHAHKYLVHFLSVKASDSHTNLHLWVINLEFKLTVK